MKKLSWRSFFSKQTTREKQGETKNVFSLSRVLEVFESCSCCCAFSFLFLKVSNWSVTFLSLAHVLFISASISSTWPPPPRRRMWVQVAFYTNPQTLPADQTRQTNIMLPQEKKRTCKAQRAKVSDLDFFAPITHPPTEFHWWKLILHL